MRRRDGFAEARDVEQRVVRRRADHEDEQDALHLPVEHDDAGVREPPHGEQRRAEREHRRAGAPGPAAGASGRRSRGSGRPRAAPRPRSSPSMPRKPSTRSAVKPAGPVTHALEPVGQLVADERAHRRRRSRRPRRRHRCGTKIWTASPSSDRIGGDTPSCTPVDRRRCRRRAPVRRRRRPPTAHRRR